MGVGRLEKKVFMEGKGVGEREYGEVVIGIREYEGGVLWRVMGD